MSTLVRYETKQSETRSINHTLAGLFSSAPLHTISLFLLSVLLYSNLTSTACAKGREPKVEAKERSRPRLQHRMAHARTHARARNVVRMMER